MAPLCTALWRSACCMWVPVAALAAVLACACSDPPPAAAPANSSASADADSQVGVIGALDLGGFDDTAAADIASHADGADIKPGACHGVPGCPCGNDLECASNVCAWNPDAAGGKTCAGLCGAGCPAGTRCATVPGIEGIQVCVPERGRACNPCTANEDCIGIGFGDAKCLDRGADGRFCGIACVAGGCPNGYACLEATTVTGQKVKQCQPADSQGKLAMCACSTAASAAALSTDCTVVAKDETGKPLGACSGTRACGPSGLALCDAPAWAPETCNGKDDDCNGAADDEVSCDDLQPCTKDVCTVAGCTHAPTGGACSDDDLCTSNDGCIGGQCVGVAKACDDGLACTTGDACVDGNCVVGTLTPPCGCLQNSDCAANDDGLLCNGSWYCDKSTPVWACKLNTALVPTCENHPNPCMQNVCLEPGDPAGKPDQAVCGAVAVPDGTTCTDQKLWTQGDLCMIGNCVAGTDTKLCKADADCAPWEDGDLCNGTLFCNKALGVCSILPKTVVDCPSANDTPCRKNLCDKPTGACKLTAVNEQMPCEDGNFCSKGEACQAGQCTASVGAQLCACSKDADCAKWEDGDACNGKLYCNLAKGACELNPATVVVCPVGLDTACLAHVCDPKSGACVVQPKADNGACDADGSPCTPYDHCLGGNCLADTALCACTDDKHCAPFEDGDLCNGTLYCEKATGACAVNPKTVVQCPSVGNTACLKNTCAPATGGCAPAPALTGYWCDDGNPCTGFEVCTSGKCAGGKDYCGCKADAGCPDTGSACLVPYCITVTATCSSKPGPDGKVCDDGNLCTAADACKAGVCGGTTKPCNDGKPCTIDSCSPSKGCLAIPAAAGAACPDDGLVCTSDSCGATGVCLHAKLPVGATCTDDGKLCTDDQCDKLGGCVHPISKGCLIGNVCVGPGLDPANPCRSCVQGATTWKLLDGAGCSDGDPCTWQDSCKASVCKGTLANCDDNNPCTTDSCAGNCAHLPNTLGCDDGNACTIGDTCADGGCTSKPKVCDDGKACTLDSCAKGACLSTAATGTCDDGDLCTKGESCQGGVCKGGGPACNDANPCTNDLCDSKTGCTNPPNTLPCDDGNACTVNDTCKAGVCQGAGKICNDTNPCTDDGCKNDVCTFANNAKACTDNNACTAGEVCNAGACGGSKPVVCNDGKLCTDDSCDPKTGCKAAPNAKPCDDGDACTVNDTCAGGLCAPGKAKVCDDANGCTLDSCAPKTGCVNAATTAPCDDGNACTSNDACASASCKGGSPVGCDDANPCTDDTCTPSQGCTHAANTAPCVAGTGCTWGDICAAGLCKAGIDAKLWAVSPAATGSAIAAVVPMVDGSVIAGGYLGNDGWLARVDKAGKTVWQKPIVGGAKASIRHLTATADGKVAFVGTIAAGGGVWAGLVDGAGALQAGWPKTLGDSMQSEPRVVELAGGLIFAFARYVKINGISGEMAYATRVVRVEPNGTTAWTSDLPRLPSNGVHAVLALPASAPGGAGLVLGQTQVSAGGTALLLVRLDANAKVVLWQKTVLPATNHRMRDVALLADGDFAVAGIEGMSSPLRSVFARLGPGGELRWSTVDPGPNHSVGARVAATADGGSLTVAYTGATTTGPWALAVVRRDTVGNLVWSAALPAPFASSTAQSGTTVDHLGRLAVLPDGALALGATKVVSGTTGQAWLARLDGWGHMDCAAAGVCASVGTSACDDATPTTADTCDVAKGCAHAPLADNAVCDDGNPCTGNGSVQQALCATATAANCDDGSACTADACDPKVGCTHTGAADGALCGSGSCLAGICAPPGATSALPIKKCSELLTLFPSAPSGVYWIKPSATAAAFQAYCLMGKSGGGWTLAMKINGAGGNFYYDNTRWTTSTTFNAGLPDFDTNEAKLGTFSTVGFTQVLLYTWDGTLRGAIGTRTASSLLSVFLGGANGALAGVTEATWKALVPGACLQNNCKAAGFNVGKKAKVRIGIVGNEQGDCDTPDSLIGFGGWVGDFGVSGISAGAFTEKTSPCGAKKILPWGYVFVR